MSNSSDLAANFLWQFHNLQAEIKRAYEIQELKQSRNSNRLPCSLKYKKTKENPLFMASILQRHSPKPEFDSFEEVSRKTYTTKKPSLQSKYFLSRPRSKELEINNMMLCSTKMQLSTNRDQSYKRHASLGRNQMFETDEVSFKPKNTCLKKLKTSQQYGRKKIFAHLHNKTMDSDQFFTTQQKGFFTRPQTKKVI